MQTSPVSWMVPASSLIPSPTALSRAPRSFPGTVKRCQSCEIPLGTQRCPNPLCEETHGQRDGDLCTWCRGHGATRAEWHPVAEYTLPSPPTVTSAQ